MKFDTDDICWGSMIAGAVVAGGAVALALYCPPVQAAIATGVAALAEHVGEWISNLGKMIVENRFIAVTTATAAGATAGLCAGDHRANEEMRQMRNRMNDGLNNAGLSAGYAR